MDSNHSSPESLREEDINEINELASREPSFIKGYLENNVINGEVPKLQ